MVTACPALGGGAWMAEIVALRVEVAGKSDLSLGMTSHLEPSMAPCCS